MRLVETLKINKFLLENKDENVHRIALSATRGEILEREREKEKRERKGKRERDKLIIKKRSKKWDGTKKCDRR